MTDDPYAALNEPQGDPADSPVPQESLPQPLDEPLGYHYEDANTNYSYGAPPPQQGAYGVPFYGQQQPPYLPMAQQPFYGRPLLEDPTGSDAPLRGMAPVDAYKRFWTRGLTFTGRASHSEFWWVALAHILLAAGAGILDNAFGGSGFLSSLLGGIVGLYFLAALVPGIALGVRRLHDTGASGKMMFLNLIPYLGSFVVAILCALPAKEEGKRFDKINQP